MPNLLHVVFFYHMISTKRKCVFGSCEDSEGPDQTARAVWSGPLLSATEIIGCYKMYQWIATARVSFCTCARWSESEHLVHVKRHHLTSCGPHTYYYHYNNGNIAMYDFMPVGNKRKKAHCQRRWYQDNLPFHISIVHVKCKRTYFQVWICKVCAVSK